MTMSGKSRALVAGLCGLVLVGGLVAETRGAAARTLNSVSKIAYQEAGGTTTVVIHGSQTPTFTVYKLERPRRLIVDLANTKVKGYEDPVEAETWAVGLITVSRFVDSRSVIARVVIGFRRKGSYNVRASGNKVIVRIQPATRRPARGSSSKADLVRARRLRAEAQRLAAQATKRKEAAAEMAKRAAQSLARARAAAGDTRRKALAEAKRWKAAAHRRRQAAGILEVRAATRLASAQKMASRLRRQALRYASRLKAQAHTLRTKAQLQIKSAEAVARKAAVALIKARRAAKQTRAVALAKARRLQAEAQTLKSQAARTVASAVSKEQALQRLVRSARTQLTAARAAAARTRIQALKKAQALEGAARERARKSLQAAHRKLTVAQLAAESLKHEAVQARAAADLANRQETESLTRAKAARARSTELLAAAREHEATAKRSAAAVTRQARERAAQARRAAAQARRQARAAQRLAGNHARRARLIRRQAAKAKRRSRSAKKAAQRARDRQLKAQAVVRKLGRLAARYAKVLGRTRQKISALRKRKADMRGELARLRQAAGTARTSLARARRLATAARHEAALYRRISARHRRVQSSLSQAQRQLHRARRALRRATDSRRREEARRAVATAARRQVELQLRQLSLARERVIASKGLLERRVKQLAARHRAAQQARKLEQQRRRQLRQAVKQAAKQRARAVTLARREQRRMNALKRASKRLKAATKKLREAAKAQMARKRVIDAAVAKISRLQAAQGAQAQVQRARLQREITRLRGLERWQGRKLAGMRRSLGKAQTETTQRSSALRQVRQLATRARGDRDRSAALARKAQEELVLARAALKTERARVARMRAERRILSGALVQAQSSVAGARSAVKKLKSSRAAQERALARVQGRLRKEQKMLARVRSQMDRESQRAEARRRAAARRLVRLETRIRRAARRAETRAVLRLSKVSTKAEQRLQARLAQLQRQARRLAAQLKAKRKQKQRLDARFKADARRATRQLATQRRQARRKARALEADARRMARRLKADARRTAAQLRAAARREAARRVAPRRVVDKPRPSRAQQLRARRLQRQRAALKRQVKNLETRLAAQRRALKSQAARAAEARRVARSRARRRAQRKVRVRSRVSRVHFVDGVWAHRVVVDLKGPIRYYLAATKRRSVTVSLTGTAIGRKLERSLDVSEFGGPVRLVSALRSPTQAGTVDIVVDLRRAAKFRLSKGRGKVYIDVWKSKTEVARFKARRGGPAALSRARVDVSSTRVAGYGAPVTAAPPGAASRRALRPYRTYRYGLTRRYSGPRVDMDFNNADVHNVLRLIGKVWRKNIVISGGVEGKVTIRLKRVRVDRALEVILKTLKLGMVWHAWNLIRIAPEADIQKELENLRLAREKKRKLAPVYTRVIALNFANAKKMAARIKENMISKRGAVSADERTNTVIVRDVNANIQAILKLVTTLDSATPQVMVEARIVEARSTFLREIGIQWGGNVLSSQGTGNPTGIMFPSTVGVAGGNQDDLTPTSGLQGAAITNPNYIVNLPATVATGAGGALGLNLGSVTGAFNINLRLSAMEDTGQVRIISSPKITVLDNVEAKIEQGVSIPISVVSAQGVNTKFENAVLSLKVKPHVTNDGNVIMKIEVEKSEPDFVNTGARGDPTILKKYAKTEMMIKDGDTAVIGGIYTRSTSRNWSKVPWFAEIPIIGWLFKKRKESDERSEVLIFITPRIIKGRSSGKVRR